MILVRWQDPYTRSCLLPAPEHRAEMGRPRAHVPVPQASLQVHGHGDYIADSGRATRNMDRLAIQRNAPAAVMVDVDKVYQEDTDGPQWAAAIVKLK